MATRPLASERRCRIVIGSRRAIVSVSSSPVTVNPCRVSSAAIAGAVQADRRGSSRHGAGLRASASIPRATIRPAPAATDGAW